MPPSATVIVRQASGQSLVLSGDDRIVKEVTIPCSSQRCPSRHEQTEPVTFTFNDQDPFPEAGDSFMSLILPERSPSNPGFPLPFCGPACARDYLIYQYLAPGPRNQKVDCIPEKDLTDEQRASLGLVRKTNLPAISDVEASVGSHDVPDCGPPEEITISPAISQADGASE